MMNGAHRGALFHLAARSTSSGGTNVPGIVVRSTRNMILRRGTLKSMNAGTLSTVFQWVAITLTLFAVLAQGMSAYYRNLASRETSDEIARLRGRTISEQQKTVLTSRLSKTRAPIGFNYRLMDGEGLDFANQLADVFRVLGWEVRHVAGNFLDDFPGYVAVVTIDQTLQQTAKLVCDSLNTANIECRDNAVIASGKIGGQFELGVIYVVIGRKG
jgi:hypothetical protein